MKQFFIDLIKARHYRADLNRLKSRIRDTSDLVDPKRPSLRVENYRYRNRRALLRELLGEEFHPFGDFQNSKLKWRKVMTELAVPGLLLPSLYDTFQNIKEINPENLPDEFVIKPDAGVASLGVLGLRKTGTNKYFNLFTGQEKSWQEFCDDFEAVQANNKIRLSTKLIVEELLIDPTTPERLPSDWKFFVGAGNLFLICRVSRFPANNVKGYENRYAFWDAERKPHPQIHQGRVADETATLPKNIDELISMAELIACSFAQPVCRIDLFNLPNRIVFGEYTPNPGGQYESGLLQDERLGRIWLDAETRYNAMLIRKVQELGHPKYGLGIWRP